MSGNETGAIHHKSEVAIKMLIVLSLIIIISGTAIIIVQMDLDHSDDLPILDPLSPSITTPSDEIFWIDIGDVSICARLFCVVRDTHSADFFSVDLYLRVNNTGSNNLQDFHLVKLSIFNEDNEHYFTFGLLPSTNITIDAHSNITKWYEGDRTLDTIRTITPEQGQIKAYGRVLISYLGHEIIVTTPMYENFYPIE